MDIFWIIYILGVIVTLYFLYHTLEKGEVVTVEQLLWAIITSSFSWLGFFVVLVVVYNDREVFKKK